jgi:hypothetical protein
MSWGKTPRKLGLRYPLQVAFLIALLHTSAQNTSLGAEVRPISFKPGQTSAQVEGQFTKNVTAVYFSLRARAGQHMRIQIKPVTPTLITAGVVIYPSGKQDGGPGGLIFDAELTESGEYRIRVTQRQSRAPGVFRLEVEIRNPQWMKRSASGGSGAPRGVHVYKLVSDGERTF